MITIKELREQKGMLSKQVANILKISPQAYSDKENGRRRFKSNEIVTICKYFEISVLEVKDFY